MWTNLKGFENLSTLEIDLLVQAPVLITILVGASDGKLDREERYWSDRLMKARTYSRPKHLHAYYRVVSENFLSKVDQEILNLPAGIEERNAVIVTRLEMLNPVLAKLDRKLAADLYSSYISLAEETAEASGGFLRIGAVSPEEAKWLSLPMLTPIHAVNTFDDEEETDDFE